jgi:hypothetical protein
LVKKLDTQKADEEKRKIINKKRIHRVWNKYNGLRLFKDLQTGKWKPPINDEHGSPVSATDPQDPKYLDNDLMN